MRRVPLITLLIAAITACASTSGRENADTEMSAAASAAPPVATPQLVVMLVVDQLSTPLLLRYDDLYTGGLRRMLDEGRFYTHASHDHGATKTAPGHASLVTGVHPSRHGIVANSWYQRTPAGWLVVENIGDSTVRVVGFDELPGVSPHYLERSTLPDWMREADPETRVASVSGKDRGAVLPAGHGRSGHVYWFEASVGRFVTSTYYRNDLPEWVEEFHRTTMAAYARDSVWESRVPPHAIDRSAPDTAAHEADGVHTYFPHRFATEGTPGQFWEWFEGTPMLDAASLDLARTMVEALELGQRGHTDFLNVALSQTDRVGHTYGPWSREQLDNLLRLDATLGEFFAFLDRTVGRGQWVLGLSSDHGVLVSPEDLRAAGEPIGRRITAAEEAHLDSLVARYELRKDDPAAPAWMADGLRRMGFFEQVWTHAELETTANADSFVVLTQRSMFPGRYGGDFAVQGVEVLPIEGFIDRLTGTGHGTPWWYDRHVPVLFMGRGIAAGRIDTPASTTDFAPTLARLIGVRTPGDLDGRALTLNGAAAGR